MSDYPLVKQIANIVSRGVAAGKVVEIEGLGSFFPDAEQGLRFEPESRPQVFIAYAKEDVELARLLYEALEAVGFSPWMDERRLLAGQNWPRAIESAIDNADFFIACYSAHSVNKKGGFQAEIRYALDCARQIPLEQIFLVPVRFGPCRVPRSIQRELQYVDLFPDWVEGLVRLVSTLRAARRRGE